MLTVLTCPSESTVNTAMGTDWSLPCEWPPITGGVPWFEVGASEESPEESLRESPDESAAAFGSPAPGSPRLDDPSAAPLLAGFTCRSAAREMAPSSESATDEVACW